MPKLLCIIDTNGSEPNLDRSVLPCTGYVYVGSIAQWAAYIVSGTAPQLATIAALTRVIGIVTVTEGGAVRWSELDGVIAAAVRTKLNNFLTARGRANVPAGWTYRQVVVAVFQALNDKFDLDKFTHDVTE